MRDRGAEGDAAAVLCTLGADIRRLRRAKGLRLVDLATVLGRSVGWLSQVERDLSLPVVADLQDIARALDVPLSTLFRKPAPGAEAGFVVRRDAHRPVQSPVAGQSDALLSPDQTDSFEVIRSVIAPGARRVDPILRATQEVGFVVSGRFDLWIAGHRFEIGPGDSFRIRGEPFAWMNPYDAPCEIVWVISPPVIGRILHGSGDDRR